MNLPLGSLVHSVGARQYLMVKSLLEDNQASIFEIMENFKEVEQKYQNCEASLSKSAKGTCDGNSSCYSKEGQFKIKCKKHLIRNGRKNVLQNMDFCKASLSTLRPAIRYRRKKQGSRRLRDQKTRLANQMNDVDDEIKEADMQSDYEPMAICYEKLERFSWRTHKKRAYL